MKLLLAILLLITTSCADAQPGNKLNVQLQKELDSMYEADQHWRILIMCVQYSVCGELNKDSIIKAAGIDQAKLIRQYWKDQATSDSLNSLRAKAILAQYGYPGKSMVGEPANEAILYIFQHSDDDTLLKYYPYMQKAAEQKEIPMRIFALMEDRALMYKGQPQKYGTQIRNMLITDSTTGQSKMVEYFWPIEDEKNVDKRRKEAGIRNTIKENGEIMGVTYDPNRINPFLHLLKKQ